MLDFIRFVIFICRCLVGCFVCFFFFKQKTAYEMRISDWSSDVCSSDLPYTDEMIANASADALAQASPDDDTAGLVKRYGDATQIRSFDGDQIGRASCRERVCQYV